MTNPAHTTDQFSITVLAEDQFRWAVKCQAPDCQNVVNTPKVTYDPDGTRHETVLAPRGCISHPPHTWR